jgi:transcriptional regulator with XRE-family HTH domain
MARAKYQEWINDPDKKTLLSGWARKGLSDQQIAKNIGISRSTLNEWRKKYPDISDTLKKGKEVADAEVENALYLKCIGHKVQLKKTFKVKKIEYNDAGKKIKEEENLETGEDEVYIPPDTKAIIFWLTNRMREDWKERQNTQMEQEETEESGVIMLAPADVEGVKEKIEYYKAEKLKSDMAAAAETGDHDEQRGR